MKRPLYIAAAWCAAIGSASAGAADCRADLTHAAALNAVPGALMDAVSYVESGYDPLSINADGTPYHPGSVDEAVRLVQYLQRSGARYIDVGCMQIDLRYHPAAFGDLRSAFDPARNADYAARYLKDNWARWGNWTQAVAYYHSADPLKQAAYVTRVKERLTGHAVSGRTRASASSNPAVTAGAPKMVTVHLSMMTITRPVSDNKPIGGR